MNGAVSRIDCIGCSTKCGDATSDGACRTGLRKEAVRASALAMGLPERAAELGIALYGGS